MGWGLGATKTRVKIYKPDLLELASLAAFEIRWVSLWIKMGSVQIKFLCTWTQTPNQS